MVSCDTRMLSSSGYWVFSQPEICFGDQSSISLLATMFRNFRLIEEGGVLGPQGRLPENADPMTGSIPRTATMTCDRQLTVDTARSKHLAISRIDEPEASPRERTPPDGRSNPPVTRHQTTNGGMFFAKSAPDLMQRLPGLPTTPHVEFLLRRKPKPPPLFHKHHTFENCFTPDGYCIDRLNRHRVTGNVEY